MLINVLIKKNRMRLDSTRHRRDEDKQAKCWKSTRHGHEQVIQMGHTHRKWLLVLTERSVFPNHSSTTEEMCVRYLFVWIKTFHGRWGQYLSRLWCGGSGWRGSMMKRSQHPPVRGCKGQDPRATCWNIWLFLLKHWWAWRTWNDSAPLEMAR